MVTNILVVDDEEDLCEILQFNLEGEGFKVQVAYSAEEALKKDLGLFQLVILDVMMGKMSGFQLARKIRQEMKLMVPILFITARDAENDTLTGFSLGADDYISKPFSIKEVIARVKAVIQRSHVRPVAEENIIRYGDLALNHDHKLLSINDQSIELTRKEYEILHLLISNTGRIFSREDLLARIWSDDVVVMSRTVDVHMARLRKKLGPFGHLLRSKPGYGYYLQKQQ